MERDAMRQRAIDLDRAWDALLDDPTTPPPPHLDDVRARVLRLLSPEVASLDLASAQERVWRRLLRSQVRTTGKDASMITPLTLSPNGYETFPPAQRPRGWSLAPRWDAWSQVVAAALLVLALVAGYLVPRAWQQTASPNPSEGLPVILTQEATPATTVAIPAWVETWITAQETEDINTFAALYAPDATYEDVAGDVFMRSKLSIKEMMGIYAAHQDDVQIEPMAFYEGDGWAVLEWTISATEILSPDGKISRLPMTDIRVATVFELGEDGLIQRSSDYPDGLEAAIQLGHVATPVPQDGA